MMIKMKIKLLNECIDNNYQLFNEIGIPSFIKDYFDVLDTNMFSKEKTSSQGKNWGQNYIEGHRILQMGDFKLLISREDNDVILDKYEQFRKGNITEQQTFADILKLLKSKYNYNVDKIIPKIKNKEIRLPPKKLGLYGEASLDSSRNRVRNLNSWGTLALGPVKHIGTAANVALKGFDALDKFNTLNSVLGSSESLRRGANEAEVRNIRGKANAFGIERENPESVKGLIIDMYKRGLLSPDSLEKIRESEMEDPLMRNRMFKSKALFNISKFLKSPVKLPKTKLPDPKIVNNDIKPKFATNLKGFNISNIVKNISNVSNSIKPK